MATNNGLQIALTAVRELERQARKNLKQPGLSSQSMTIRLVLDIRNDAKKGISVGGQVLSQIPTEPIGGEIGGEWTMSSETGVVGRLEIEKTIRLEENGTP